MTTWFGFTTPELLDFSTDRLFVFIYILALFRRFLGLRSADLQVGTAPLLSQGYLLTPHGFCRSV
jgi:hypothetical protein